MLTLLGINKVLAIYVGPAGYAALGQFQNAIQIVTVFTSSAIGTSVTKYTAEYHNDECKQRSVWRTAGTISLVSSLVIAVGIVIFNKSLAALLLKDSTFGSVFIWFSTTLVFFSFNTLLLSILNGKKEIQLYVTANITGSFFALTVTAIMVIQLGLYGALVAFAIYQSVTFFVTLAITCKASWFKVQYLLGAIDKKSAKNMAKFVAMALTSATCVPISHILIRDYLGGALGWDAAGYWDAMWRLSSAYLMLVTTTLGVYYLPKLSELQNSSEIKKEILQGYKIILPVAAACGLAVYLLRGYIVRALFTTEFTSMEVLFGWQMVGDTLKIGGWILAYLVLSKALFKIYIVSEILFSITFPVLTIFFIERYGFVGVSIAHAVNYLFYWIFMMVFLRRYFV